MAQFLFCLKQAVRLELELGSQVGFLFIAGVPQPRQLSFLFFKFKFDEPVLLFLALQHLTDALVLDQHFLLRSLVLLRLLLRKDALLLRHTLLSLLELFEVVSSLLLVLKQRKFL